MKVMKILLVEDNQKLVEKVSEYLKVENFEIETAPNGLIGFNKANTVDFDCIVLDINMPVMDGFEVCKKLRNEGINTPILFLTALGDKKNTIKGLNLGADDYLSKPFNLDELVARINSLLRRYKNNKTRLIKHSNLKMNTKTHEVFQNNLPVKLSPREYDLLRYLLLNKGKAVTHSDIIENVWRDYNRFMFSRTIDVHIAYLRKKLGKDLITTVKGTGYLIKN